MKRRWISIGKTRRLKIKKKEKRVGNYCRPTTLTAPLIWRSILATCDCILMTLSETLPAALWTVVKFSWSQPMSRLDAPKSASRLDKVVFIAAVCWSNSWYWCCNPGGSSVLVLPTLYAWPTERLLAVTGLGVELLDPTPSQWWLPFNDGWTTASDGVLVEWWINGSSQSVSTVSSSPCKSCCCCCCWWWWWWWCDDDDDCWLNDKFKLSSLEL